MLGAPRIKAFYIISVGIGNTCTVLNTLLLHFYVRSYITLPMNAMQRSSNIGRHSRSILKLRLDLVCPKLGLVVRRLVRVCCSRLASGDQMHMVQFHVPIATGDPETKATRVVPRTKTSARKRMVIEFVIICCRPVEFYQRYRSICKTVSAYL